MFHQETQQEINERDRRNYALISNTCDAENFLQICCGGQVIVTVTAPSGPVEPEFFLVFNGDGLDADDNELTEKEAVKIFAARGDKNKAWRQAAMFGHQHALAKMMTADEREEREMYSYAA